MFDIPTISAVIAATGVVVGFTIAILQLRHLVRTRQDMVKTRQADLLMRLYSTWGSEDLQKAATEVMNLESKTLPSYAETSEKPTHKLHSSFFRTSLVLFMVKKEVFEWIRTEQRIAEV